MQMLVFWYVNDASIKTKTIIITGGFYTFYLDKIDNRDLDVISIVSNVVDRYGIVYKLKNRDANKDYKFVAIGKVLEYAYNSSVGYSFLTFSTKDTECTVWFIYQ